MSALNICLTVLPNALHTEFHCVVVDLIERLDADRIGLEPGVVRPYVEVVRQEQAHVVSTFQLSTTKRLKELDRQRNDLLGALLSRLRYARISPLAVVQAAVPDIEREIVHVYPFSIKREAAQRKSVQISSLLSDLRRIDAEVLQALGVDTMCADLERVNDEFLQTYLLRNKELAERGIGVMAARRPEADRLYRRLCVEATYMAGRADEVLAALGDDDARAEATARREAAREFVDELQEHIDFYKAHYLSRRYSSRRAPAAEDGAQES